MLRTALQSATGRGYSAQDVEHIAEQAWSGVVSTGGATLIGQGVADTTPREYATLVAVDDIAAAFAAACQIEIFTSRHGLPDTPHAARERAREGWAVFRELADQAGHLEHGTGADLSAAWPRLKAIQERTVDEQKIRKIAAMAGRMYVTLKGQKAKKARHVPERVVGVETGSDIGSLLPSEYALLGAPGAREDLLARITRRQALQLKREGKQKKGRGPLVLALDESGSMEDDRDIWAKSVMTALTRIAWEEKRPVRVVHFSTATRVHRLDPKDHRALIEAQSLFLDGGTDIGTALDVAADEVEDMAKHGIPGADVVLISDGGDASGRIAATLDRLDRNKVRLWSIAIGPEFRGLLKDRAAQYIHVAGDGAAEDVAAVGGAVGA